ncbi:glycosyltransferase family 2 protein [Candidatus Pelagibacter communis]|uniref:glycosyltransferase family 2 protein n=1 Tax=Pelagibacter ubique TaxID=198252 RepID=UPI00094DAE7E|nr:glycosyltransferase [Candidatus Pelagibacter ubique]|tara:strand:+ start:407 stop:1294 length:888 start_codon:yes stop_codon:yes gene_type:complete
MNITILIISYRSIKKLDQCLYNIGKKINVIIVENSDNKNLKKEIEKKYPNSKVILNNSNLGYSTAANIGIKEIKTKYVLLINTDILIKDYQVLELEKEIESTKEDFSLATPYHDDLEDFIMNNNFDKFLENRKTLLNDSSKITKIDLLKGCSILINLNKFDDNKIFDQNYFFFFEEIDLCRQIKEKGESIYVFNKIRIKHENAKGFEGDAIRYQNFRNWNYLWSSFYYNKKHYGFLTSFLKHLGKLLRFGFFSILFIPFSKDKFRKYKFCFLGLLSSIIGRNSNLSVKILEEKIL